MPGTVKVGTLNFLPRVASDLPDGCVGLEVRRGFDEMVSLICCSGARPERVARVVLLGMDALIIWWVTRPVFCLLMEPPSES